MQEEVSGTDKFDPRSTENLEASMKSDNEYYGTAN